MARNAFYKNTGCTKSKSWPGSTIQKPEVLSKVPEMVRNAVKFIFIRKMREKSRRGSGVLGLLLVKSEFGVAESEKRLHQI